MSASNASTSSTTYPVQVTAGNPRDVVTIYDSAGVQRAREVGGVTLSLPRGLYTLRVQFAAETRDEVLKVIAPVTKKLEAVNVYSATPLTDAVTSHEYYTDPSVECSKTPTRPAPLPGRAMGMSRIMLFFRALDHNAKGDMSFADRLTVCDAQGNAIADFSAANTRRNDASGWIALSADAPPGFYRLRYDGKTPREVALRLTPRWATYWFIFFDKEPRFDTMTGVMSRPSDGFHPSDDDARAIDLGLWSLQNGFAAFPREAANKLLMGKFDNPLMGLIGAWLLLRKPGVKEQELLAPLANLRRLLGDQPDVVALEAAAREKWASIALPPVHLLTEPPMLRAGLDALIEISIRSSAPIVEGSLLDRLLGVKYGDSPWTTWKPLDAQEHEVDWVDRTVAEALMSAFSTKRDSSRIDIQTFARIAGLPQRVIKQRVQKLRSLAATAGAQKVLDSERPGELLDALSKATF
jgi:hypothetical protein